MKNTKASLETQVTELKNTIISLTKERNMAQSNSKKLEAVNTELKAKNAELDTKNRALQVKVQDLNKEINGIVRQGNENGIYIDLPC